MAIKKNYWASITDYDLFDFGITLENVDTPIEKVLDFIEEVLRISRKYSVCIVDFGKENDLDYIDYLKSTWDDFGYIYPFYLPGYKYYSRYNRYAPTSLFFYSKGVLVNEVVSLLCNYEYEAGYTTFKECNGHFFYEGFNISEPVGVRHLLMPPIEFTMNVFRKGTNLGQHWSLSGRILNDIWLPKVNFLKVWNEEEQIDACIDEMDNSELALLNTPKLNSFMRDLKQLCHDLNGKWYMGSELKISCVDDHAIPIDGKIIYY